MTKIAVLQMTSGIDPAVNFERIRAAANDAAEGGAEVLFTPEMSVLLDRNRKRAAPWIESVSPDDMIARLQALAAENQIDIALGSMPITYDATHWANRSFYFSRSGDGDGKGPISYDKIHMFDVALSSGESWRESAAYHPGDRIVVARDTPLGDLGLTICYDLRFPALFDALGQERCNVIAVPAAFTVPTGEAHWHVMLRARAIEASAYIVAAAQVGTHEDGRSTYGHSLVIDPWGEILLDMGGEEAGLGFCDVDLSRIAEVRAQLPSLYNRRKITN